MSTSVTVVVGNPKPASRTLTVAAAVADEVDRLLGGDTTRQVIDLGEHTDELFDWSSAKVAALVESVIEADLLVVASPVYKASYTGLLKVFLDRIGGGALYGTLAVPVMVGGAPGHALAVEVHLRPLLVELGVTCTSPGLFVLESTLDALDEQLEGWSSSTGELLRRALA